ncbi:MAG: hypothetical protein HQL66_01680 [Magnetococcales bacterium]|nr:hypothetical protein [Magnetococcales bacterium]
MTQTSERRTATAVLLFVVVLLVVLAGVKPAAAVDPNSDAYCERCHGMATMAYRDQRTGRLVNLFVDQKKLAQSSHKTETCLDCHSSGFKKFPHDAASRLETRHCVDCHVENKHFSRKKFEKIEREFLNSVHFQAMPDRFDCFSCHDPHTFQSTTKETEVSLTVARDNAICLGCHDTPVGAVTDVAAASKKRVVNLEVAHGWLPEVKLHWRAVRCLECHTPTLGGSHVIVKATYAERDCVSCHSHDSILKTKLYKYRAQEDRQKAGFINSAVLNDAYIVGMTRNRWVDDASLALVGLTLLGVSLHGLGRWFAARRHNRTRR